MLDKCYIRNLKATCERHSKSLGIRLRELKDFNKGSWYSRANERDLIFDSIENLKEIVDAQSKLIDTICNDRLNEFKASNKENNETKKESADTVVLTRKDVRDLMESPATEEYRETLTKMYTNATVYACTKIMCDNCTASSKGLNCKNTCKNYIEMTALKI